MINNYYNEIRSDIAKEFGLEAGGYSPRPTYALTLRQCQVLLNKYGMDKASIIVKRYASLAKVVS
jgi:hypothetical protein